MSEQRKIRLVIADDHFLIREGLKQILQLSSDMQLVAEAERLPEIQQVILNSFPTDILLLDLTFPEGNSVALIPELKKIFPDRPRILVLTVHSAAQYAPQCFAAGANGFLQKECSPKELFSAIRKVHAGQIYDEEGWFQSQGSREVKNGKNSRSLSRREKQVLINLAEGRSTVEISKSLGLSPNTIKTYRSRLLGKLGFRNEADLIRYALVHNLFP